MGSSLDLALLVLCVEFALVAAGILFFARRAGKAQEARVVDNVTSLVNTVERSEGQRREALLITMQDTYRMDAAEAERVVSDFIEREHAFYNALIGVHLGRSGKSLADVPAELTKLIAPWLRVTPRGQVDKSAVEALETSKAAVESELSDTRKVLDELMAEYNAAFNRAQQDKDVAPPAAPAAAAHEIPHDELLSIDDPVLDAPPSGDDELDKLLAGDDDAALDEADAVDIEVPPLVKRPSDQTIIDLDEPADGAATDAAMSQDDLDALLEGTPPAAPAVAAGEADDGAPMSQDDLDALLEGAPTRTPAAAPVDVEPPPEEEIPEVPMSQADLDALLENLDDDLFSGKPQR